VFSNSVAIGPEFFTKSVNDYRDKYWAFAREILQNSLDCGSTWIDIRLDEDEANDRTLVVVTNNGTPMTREIIEGKLLSLGSSGKDFRGAVGGFGKAKELLYFAHHSYAIDSGSWRVVGSGAGYEIEPGEFLLGTRSAVTWEGTVAGVLRDKFRRFIHLLGRRGCQFTLDGEAVEPEIPRFRKIRPLELDGVEWANLAAFKHEDNLLVIRIAGLPMFVERSDLRLTIVLELTGDSGSRLTANRDGLKWPYSTRLNDLMVQMAVDRRSALTLEEPVYTRCAGPKLGIDPNSQPGARPATPAAGAAGEIRVAARGIEPPDAGGGIRVEVRERREAPMNVLPYEFVVKNCVKRKLPREFDPLDIKFSDHAFWLANAWSGCLLELYALHENPGKFSIGFVLSQEVEAESEKSAAYGQVYFLNPCHVTKKAITRRWKKANRGAILATAVHEFVHGALDVSYHGEDFANKQTDVMGMVLNHWRRFARHLS
jgi:hypothetical protein